MPRSRRKATTRVPTLRARSALEPSADAAVQFEKAMGIIRQQGKSSQMSLLLDAQMANATAQLRSNNLDGAKKTADALGQLYPAEWGATPSPSPPPLITPTPAAQF